MPAQGKGKRPIGGWKTMGRDPQGRRMVPENADRISTLRSKNTRLSARDDRATPLHGAKRAAVTLAHTLSGHRISPVQRHDVTIKIWDLMTTTHDYDKQDRDA